MNKKNLLIISLVSIIFFIFGLYIGVNIIGEKNKKWAVDFAIKYVLDENLKIESDNSMHAYIFKSKEVGIHSLEHLNNFFALYKKYDENSWYSTKAGDDLFVKDKAITYVRIGLLYQKNNELNKAKEYFKKGFQMYGKEGKVGSEAKLIELVQKLDENYLKFYDK